MIFIKHNIHYFLFCTLPQIYSRVQIGESATAKCYKPVNL
jgi:hypothetical protein